MSVMVLVFVVFSNPVVIIMCSVLFSLVLMFPGASLQLMFQFIIPALRFPMFISCLVSFVIVIFVMFIFPPIMSEQFVMLEESVTLYANVISPSLSPELFCGASSVIPGFVVVVVCVVCPPCVVDS